MKTTKRIIAMTAALAISACMAVPAMMSVSAADVYVDTTSGDSTNGYMADTETHTYTAYQVFTGTYSGGGLQVTDWGTGYDSAGLLADTAFTALVSGVTTSDTAAQVAQKIETANPDADALAKVLYKHKGAASGTALSQDSSDKTSLGDGYYVIDDTRTDVANTADAVSKFMLKVAGDTDITITPKKAYPTVEKKVQENSDVTGYSGMGESASNHYNDVADYCIGDAVPFKLYGSMPANLDDYDHYYYKFTDTLGSQFDQPIAVTIVIEDTTLTAAWDSTENKYTVTGETGTNCRVTWNNGILTVSFEDIKAYTGVDKDTVVTVSYTAVLNDTANIGLPGQENKVDLTYSNNPNIEYTPDTSNTTEDVPKDDNGTPNDDTDDTDATDKTPEDKVIVFTYELDTTKKDGDTGATLANAKFKLANAATGGQYAILIPKTVSGKTNVYTFGGWDTTGTGTEITTDSNGIFYILGLDEGDYWLDETEAPATYTGLSSRQKMTLVADTLDLSPKDNQNWSGAATDALSSLSLSINNGSAANSDDASRGIVAATINNTKSSTLPSTGGIGTTLFILGGGCAAGIGGIYLISKKRAGKEE